MEKKHSAKCAHFASKECDCDCYHTFDELYEHRIRLFIELCKAIAKDRDRSVHPIWASTTHHDGSTFGDWFIMGIDTEAGKMMTYHLPARFWLEVCEIPGIQLFEKAPEWDGHTSDDVLTRLSHLS